MSNKDSNWSKFFLGFAVVTVLSGIYLIFQKDYFIGISGSITGAFLIYMNLQQTGNEEQ